MDLLFGGVTVLICLPKHSQPIFLVMGNSIFATVYHLYLWLSTAVVSEQFLVDHEIQIQE